MQVLITFKTADDAHFYANNLRLARLPRPTEVQRNNVIFDVEDHSEANSLFTDAIRDMTREESDLLSFIVLSESHPGRRELCNS